MTSKAVQERPARTVDEIRDAYGSTTGFWPAMLEPVLQADPELVDAPERQVAVPYRKRALEPKIRELVGLAVNASTTHLFEPAIREHIRNAVRLGATRDELIETLELACALGVHTATASMPLLREELEKLGEGVGGAELTPHQQQVKASFTAGRQSWTNLLEDFLRLDPDWLAAYVDYSTVPWKRGVLPPKVKELIYVAIDVQTSHLYERGTRFHVGNALRQGATRDEILEVLELVSIIGMHTMVMAVPILLTELDAAQAG